MFVLMLVLLGDGNGNGIEKGATVSISSLVGRTIVT
jgi:hypothetical protein